MNLIELNLVYKNETSRERNSDVFDSEDITFTLDNIDKEWENMKIVNPEYLNWLQEKVMECLKSQS